MPRPTRKANPAPAPAATEEPETKKTTKRGGKRPAEEAAEGNVAVPNKTARTALGKTKQPTVNGLNNNGPDDQPAVSKKPSATTSTRTKSNKQNAEVEVSRPDITGYLYCFGNNDCGQLGLPEDVEKRKFPSKVPSLDNKKIIDVACGGMHTLALDENGTVWSFGVNDDKALGRKTEEEEDGFEPGKVDLPNGLKAIQITAGDSHSAALTQDGQVFIWGCFKDGNGNFGLLADEGEMCRENPQNITNSMNVKIKKIASGAHHIAMLGVDGFIYTCGTGDQGQLGRVMPVHVRATRSKGLDAGADKAKFKKEFLLNPTKVLIGRNAKIRDIWTGEFSTYCCTEKNDIYVFGLNNYSQLGIPNKTVVVTKATCNTKFKGHDIKQIAAGQHHAIVLDQQGKVYTLGRSNDGRLGLGKIESSGEEDSDMVGVPTITVGLEDIKCKQVAAGGSTTYAVTDDGQLYSWGFGENWQLATGDEEDRDVPTLSHGGRDKPMDGKVLKVTAGSQHVALMIDRDNKN